MLLRVTQAARSRGGTAVRWLATGTGSGRRKAGKGKQDSSKQDSGKQKQGSDKQGKQDRDWSAFGRTAWQSASGGGGGNWTSFVLGGALGLWLLSRLRITRVEERRLTFHDFVHSVLPYGDVGLLVVDATSNKVRVFSRGEAERRRAGLTGAAPSLSSSSSSSGRSETLQPTVDSSEAAALLGLARPLPRDQLNLQPEYQLSPTVRTFFTIGSTEAFERRLDEATQTLGLPAPVPVEYSKGTNLGRVFVESLPTMLLVGFLAFSLRQASKQLGSGGIGGLGGGRGGPFSFGQSKAKKYNREDNIKTRFKDVAGLPEAKQEIQEFVDFLKQPERFVALGAHTPKGALLSGPPGTGKTLLAKAAAGEAGVPFFVTSGSEFLEMFVGVGPSRVRDLFKQARAEAPAIVFIDEIDAIGRSRASGRGMGNEERENTLNALLVEMDGFKQDTGIVVFAGTNRADVLDSALLRAGRFDRQIVVDNPDLKSRVEILLVHMRKVRLLPAAAAAPGDETASEPASVYEAGPEHEAVAEPLAQRLALLTPAFSGADLANVCNEAAIVAARRDAACVEQADFEAAIDRVVGGLEKRERVVSPEERRMVAYNEAGKAIAAWFLPHAEPLIKVSIVPRAQASMGYAQYEQRDRYLRQSSELLDLMCQLLGGRAAVEMALKTTVTGAERDLKRATRLAYQYLSVYGFGDAVGLLSFQQGEGGWGSPNFVRGYSDQTAEKLDDEARQLVRDALARSRALLEARREQLDQIAELLLEKEVVRKDDLERILGKGEGNESAVPGSPANGEDKADGGPAPAEPAVA